MENYDVLIIGAGPAGLTAAIYCARKRLKTLVISKDIGGQAALSGDIENYLGFSVINGVDLATKFREHAEEFNDEITLVEGTTVASLLKTNANFQAVTKEGDKYSARTVIIASGRKPRFLGIPGEQAFFGKGVSTCATCDAPLFRNKDVAVIGGGSSAMDATVALTKFTNKIYVVNIDPELMGDEILKEQVTSSDKVEVIGNTLSQKIFGDKFVTGIEIKDKITGKTRTLTVGGVFIEIGQIPATGFDKITEKDDHGLIKVDSDLRTNMEGVWAAGDVNDLWGEQIIIAAGEGAKAAMRLAEYLAKQRD